jgi:HTH-type transcriptional regulator/antitoxin HigA
MTMTATNATWVKHPGYYIREEMEAREWLQRDLAFILGVPEQSVNLILSGRRNLSPEMALALADAFDTDREFFSNLQQAYDLAHARQPDPKVAMRGNMQSRYPVREMARRGWLAPTGAALSLEEQLMRFFNVSFPDEIPYLAHAAKRGRYEEREIPPVELAWLFRVRQIARSFPAAKYSESGLRAATKEFERLLLAPEEARHVPRILADCGVRLVIVEKLPSASIDGVCFWLDPDSPVIGLSMRRDTIDNFWFCVRHECEHVLMRDGQDEEVIDVLEGDRASATSEAISEQERHANAVAADFCVPVAKMDSFMVRKRPYYYEKDVLAFARIHHRHPGLVVGQMQKRMDRWDYLTRHLVKVRQSVIPNAIVDGWGHVAPVSL